MGINYKLTKVTILWKSKSGRIYDLADTDIDCNDIELWFDKLDPLLCQKQMFPKEELVYDFHVCLYILVYLNTP